MTLLDEMARQGLHLVQDGPWNSVFVVLSPPCDCYQAVTVAL